MATSNEENMTIEHAGKFVPTPEMDSAGTAWLSLTDEQRSELLHQRRAGRIPGNALPSQQQKS